MSEPRTAVRVLVWNEGLHERDDSRIRSIYPHGLHGAIADGLNDRLGATVEVRTATLHDDEHGLTADALANTDVLMWWGHIAHDQVSDDVVTRVKDRVLAGMGLIVLHSGHFSKIFRDLMGTTCSLAWRNDAEKEAVWTVAPAHPIAQGLPQPIVIPQQEMYGEFFDIPAPDEVVFISAFEGGEAFRSGVTFHRGNGRIFYFSPGDESYPVYFQGEIRQVLANAVMWARPVHPDGEKPQVSNPPRTLM